MQLTVDLQSSSLKKILIFLRALFIGVLYSGLFTFLFTLSHAFWFLPAGLRFVALVYLRPVYWPALLVGELLAHTYLTGAYNAHSGLFDHIMLGILSWLSYAVMVSLVLRKRAWISRTVINQSELGSITVAIVTAALISATFVHLLMPGDSSFLIFEKFSVKGIFSYTLGDVAGVLFIWPPVAFIQSFMVMDKSERYGFATSAAYVVLPITIAIALLNPVFNWATLALMFVPVVLLSLKHGWPGATFSLVVMNLSAGVEFLLVGNTGDLFDNQVFLVSVGFTGLFLGAAISHQAELMKRIRNFSQRVITTQETERNRIAQDVHDHIGQVLTALTLRIAILRQRASAELKNDFDLLEKMAAQVFHDVHEIVGELSPREISHFGLKRSLESPPFHKMLEASGITYTSTIDSGVTDIPEQTQTAIYRISQEALSNIAKHSQATRCSLKVSFFRKQRKTMVCLEIQDDGAGFDVGMVNNGHGLQNIEDRVQSFMGNYVISSTASGTRLNIALPV